MGWSMARYRAATITEYTLAATGYWQNWERHTVWAVREMVYTQIALDPYTPSNKKASKKDLYRLSIDKVKEIDIDQVIKEAGQYENKLKKGLHNG